MFTRISSSSITFQTNKQRDKLYQLHCRVRTRGAIILQGPHQVAEKSMTTNFCSLDAFKMAASTSWSVPGSATAPPRSRTGKRLDTPKTEGMKGLLEAVTQEVLVGACTGTVAVALENIINTMVTRGIPMRKRVKEGIMFYCLFSCWINMCLEICNRR